MKRILVATDGSKAAQEAELKAVDLAQRLNLELTLVYAVDPPLLPDSVNPFREFLPAHKAWAHEMLASRLKALGVHSQTIDARVVVGHPAAAIAEAALAPDVELVVVGSRGGHAAQLLGSVAMRLGQLCKKPLLIVHSQESGA
jgi:nucleotide-binding universal stress UspA family protein